MLKFNAHTSKLDHTRSNGELDALYVNVTGDTMTGDLSVPTIHATGAGASTFNEGLIVNEAGGGAATDDFRVETDTNANAFVVDASADQINITVPVVMECIQFDTTPTTTNVAEGLLRWNATDGTLDLGMSAGNITMQLGQELFAKVRNDSGAPIVDGQVVYISGRTGVYPDVKLARADAESTSRVLGVATHTIPWTGDKFGYVTTFGYVRGLKTDYTGDGVWGTTWVTGDILYLSKDTAGQLTNIEPDEPHHSDIIGSVGVVSDTQGSILVLNEKHYTLEQLTDVDGTALTTTGQLPVWNQTAGYFDFNYNLLTDFLKIDQTTPQSVINGTPSFADIKIPVQSLGTPTYSTVNDFCNSFGSCGRKTGGIISDAGSSKVAVTAGTGFIKATDDDNAQLMFCDWSAPANITIPANSTRYIGVEYSGGSAQVVSRTSFNWNLDSEFPLGRVVNDTVNGAEVLYVANAPWWITDGTTNITEAIRSFGLIRRDDNVGGLLLSVTGTRNISVTSGTIWTGLNELAFAGINTAVSGTVEYYWYKAGSGWQVSDVSQYSVLQWNNVTQTTLQNISTNKYCNIWVYGEVAGASLGIALLYPQTEYNTAAAAEAVTAPTTVPTHISEIGKLLGRIIIKQGTDAPVSVQTVFTTIFSSSVVTDHGNLSGLSDDDHGQYWQDTVTRTGNYVTSGSVTAASLLVDHISEKTASHTIVMDHDVTITAGKKLLFSAA